MKKYRGFFFIFLMLGGIVLAFLLIPLLMLFYHVGPVSLWHAFEDPEVLAAIGRTFLASFMAVLFVLLTGIPLAYLLARQEFPGRAVVESLIDLPVMVPHTAAGIALLVAFGSGGFHRIFEALGLGFVDTMTGIVAAMTFLSAPFLINAAKEGFRKVDPRYEKMARTLGAGPFNTFFSVVLPNARGEIVNGALMMWSRGLGEFGAVVILAYHPMIAPVLIYDRFTQYGLSGSAPVAAAMILLSIGIFTVIRTLNNRMESRGKSG